MSNDMHISVTDSTITVRNRNGQHSYALVSEVPPGYTVWNIGAHNMAPGYLPLCRLSLHQPFPGACQIDPDSLKAIRVDGAEFVLNAIGRGHDTSEKMERYIKRYAFSKSPLIMRRMDLYCKAIPVLKQIRL